MIICFFFWGGGGGRGGGEEGITKKACHPFFHHDLQCEV